MKKNNKKKEHIEAADTPKVLATGRTFSTGKVSRRDFLKMAAVTLTAAAVPPFLISCGQEPPIHPTSTPDIPNGTINAADVPLLKQPGDLSGVILVLAADAAVKILERDASDTWFKVRTDKGKEGWVPQKRVTASFTSEEKVLLVPMNYEQPILGTPEKIVKGKTNSSTDVLSKPGSSNIVEIIYSDETIEILERDSSDNWYKIKTASGKTGWVKQSDVTVNIEFRTTINNYVKINYSVIPVPPKPAPPPQDSGPSITTHYWHPN